MGFSWLKLPGACLAQVAWRCQHLMLGTSREYGSQHGLLLVCCVDVRLEGCSCWMLVLP